VDDSLDDAHIISLVTTQGTEEPDSDEGEDPLPVPISHSDAMSCVETLKEYVIQHAETFGVALCHELDDVQRKIAGLALNRKTQTDIRTTLGAGTQ
jgi:hypothetical protein